MEAESVNANDAGDATRDPNETATSSSDNGDDGDGGNAAADPGGTDDKGDDTSSPSDDPSSDDTCDSGASASSVGDPIDLRLADKSHVQVDYLGRGAGPLRLARNYHSNLAVHAAQVSIPMGTGWRNYYDRSMQVLSGSTVRLHRANGRVLDYSFNGSTWASAMPGGVLTPISGGWQYVNHRNVVETYAANGRLVSLSLRGHVATLAYDSSAHLIEVSNPFGRSLAFRYDAAGRVASVTLPDGNALSYAYDASNNLISMRFADSSVRQYVYENGAYRNALTGVVDETGRRRLTWGYDDAGRPNYGHYGIGANRVSISYSGSQVVTTDARGTQRIRTYSAAGPRKVLANIQTAATADSAAVGWAFSYDGNGNPTQVVSRTGEVRQFVADSRGRIVNATRAAGSALALQTQSSWHPVYRKRLQVVSRGVTQNKTVDGLGRVTQVSAVGTNGATVITRQKAYNAQNLLQSITDARGGTRSYTYDAAGNVASIINQGGQTAYLSNYNAHGQVGRIARPDGTTIVRSYDQRGRLVARTAGSETTALAYDNAGRLTQITAPDGSWRRRSYDVAGYLTNLKNHRGEATTLGRDVDGKLVNQINYSSGGTVTQARYTRYDALGRVAAVLDSQNNRGTQLRYSADARMSGLTTPVGQTFGQQLDLLDRPVMLTQPNTTAMRLAGGPASVSAALAYNVSNATHRSTTDTVSVATSYAVDAFNRRVAEAGADAGSKSTLRNAAGDVTVVTDARGVTRSFARDSFGRVTSITGPGGSVPKTFSYVPGRTDSLPSRMTDLSGSTAWTYDTQGRPLTKVQTVAGNALSLSISRDTIGRVASMTYPSGARVGVSYIGDQVSALSVNGVTLLSNITYLPLSQTATGWRWGNGSSHSRTINADGQVTSVTLGSALRSYSYDAAGRITAYTDTGAQGARASSLAYDEAGQLIAYSGPAGRFSYAYDTNGNRRSAVQNGLTSNFSFVAGSNRLVSGPRGNYRYNADGNPATDGYLSYAYDADARLILMTSPSLDSSSRTYNGQGIRVASATLVREYIGDQAQGDGVASAATLQALDANGSAPPRVERTTATVGRSAASSAGTASVQVPRLGIVEKSQVSNLATAGGGGWIWVTDDNRQFFHADDGSLLGEYDLLSDYKQETIWFNGQPVGTLINGKLYYVRSDHLGTPRSIARSSDNAEVWRWDSDPFGNLAPTNPIPAAAITYNLRFAGQQYDRYSGYFYNWMRDYDPFTGRYLQADPIGLGGGLSRYAYVGGNPISRTDPTGLISYEAQKFLDRLFGPTPDTSRCVTAECAAGLLPASSDNRTQSQIDYGQCKLVCNIAAAAPVAACNAAAGGGIPGAILGTAGRLSVCAMVCKP